MASLDFDISQWYNEDDLDYRTLELAHGSRSTSLAPQDQRRPGLPLLQLADWNPNLPYDESPPTCIHYSIEWKMLTEERKTVKAYKRYRTEPSAGWRVLGPASEAKAAAALGEEDAAKQVLHQRAKVLFRLILDLTMVAGNDPAPAP